MATIKVLDKVFTNITGIIFDKDGTLADSHNYLRELAQKRSRLIDAQVPGVGEPLLMSFGMLDGVLDPAGLMAVGSHHENAIAAAAYIAETGRSWFDSLDIAKKAFYRSGNNAGRSQPNFTYLSRLSKSSSRLSPGRAKARYFIDGQHGQCGNLCPDL